ncbi:MAG: methylated-DNA--[protein]-cysteine S-methyltransferase [Spirochaetales bacterium]|nr:methylated-DNA--[protein]-cysteine S-methyltransferase [Spirochaetales bacterium]
MIRFTTIKTPLGEMRAASFEGKICLIEFTDRVKMDRQLRTLEKYYGKEKIEERDSVLDDLEGELNGYFTGELTDFTVPLIYRGTPFEEKVWEELIRVPYGTTRSYGEQAVRLGNPKAVRAVAGANSRNRIALVIPCHRIIGQKGTLTGYAGGLDRKARLLELERENSVFKLTGQGH